MLVKFGARLPIRGGNRGVQHGLSIALVLVRDELDAVDVASTVAKQPGPLKSEPSPSQATKDVQAKPALLDLQSMPDDAFVRQARLLNDVVPVSSATLWRWVKAGTFPAPVKLSSGMTAWRVGDVRAWMQARKKSENR